jgi:hypothetical protein
MPTDVTVPSQPSALVDATRKEFADDRIDVSRALPSITTTEFRDGAYRPRSPALRRGTLPHTSSYGGRIVLRALHTGEARIDIPPGSEQPEITA